jgi:hypothetical protein
MTIVYRLACICKPASFMMEEYEDDLAQKYWVYVG